MTVHRKLVEIVGSVRFDSVEDSQIMEMSNRLNFFPIASLLPSSLPYRNLYSWEVVHGQILEYLLYRKKSNEY